MKFHLILFLFCLPSLVISQEGKWWSDSNDTTQVDDSHSTSIKREKGEVIINKDPKIEKLIAFKGETIPPAFGPQIDGYRVQLFFDQSKEAVNNARARFLTSHSNEDTYITYRAPNYNLTVGNFRTELEAEKLRASLAYDFPEGIVISTRIYLPKIED